jgi:hypothetical protein
METTNVLLQQPEYDGYDIEQGSPGIRLDDLLDASEFCCLCRLCLSRNDTIAVQILDYITDSWTVVTSTRSVDILKKD